MMDGVHITLTEVNKHRYYRVSYGPDSRNKYTPLNSYIVKGWVTQGWLRGPHDYLL